MPRPRTPLAKATLQGSHIKDPQRYRDRREPAQTPIGAAPDWYDQAQRKAWANFCRELPWLTESDRAILEIAVPIRAAIASGDEVGLTRLNLYRLLLGQLGASPADRSKISIPPEEEQSDEFFN